ncbi:MAG: hypothetical protein M1833_002370 [Piccolia ochrophora]|nr:MAG: hypothetical protein M1833_002370 [Piccolia ochrophora]
MPVSHIGLTVSHLPQSTSFFLTALQPLGYKFLGQKGNQIGFGVYEPDFFICQETPGVPPGPVHVAFNAPTRSAVDGFYAAALRAGGRSHGSPAVRNASAGYYSAAVLDIDGNSIEVVYRTTQSATSPRSSGVLTWQKTVARSLSDDESVVSTAKPSSTARAKTTTTTIQHAPAVTPVPSQDFPSAKALIGTLLGAAGGAAVAYAMMKSEREDEVKRQIGEPPTHTITMIDRTLGERSLAEARPTPAARPASQAPTRDLGTLISSFITPQASTPLLQTAPGPSSASTSPQSAPRSITATARAAPLPSSHTSRTSTLQAARTTALPPSSSSAAPSANTAKSRTTNATASTIKPANPSQQQPQRINRTSTLSLPTTVSPNDSVSNADDSVARSTRTAKGGEQLGDQAVSVAEGSRKTGSRTGSKARSRTSLGVGSLR